MISMPGTSYSGALPPLSAEETEISASLRRDVQELAGRIGPRNLFQPDSLRAAAEYIEGRLGAAGYKPERQTYEIRGKPFHNLQAELGGGPEVVVVGAHYDSVPGCPGANDNASGVAALLALAAASAGAKPARKLRFVAFTSEEPPYFQTDHMGSRVYARRCRERGENVVAMLSLETIGCYSDREGSQRYPSPFGWFYPSTGNFIAFVGNLSSRGLVRRSVRAFREKASFPSEGGALPSWVPGVGWSDQWSFWKEGYPALMVTDTAPFRYPEYHLPSDTPDKVEYDRTARVVRGLGFVVRELAGF